MFKTRTIGPVAGLCVMLLSNNGLADSTPAQGPYYATPSWSQKLPSATRFITLTNWNSQAVLDRETGLVWAAGSTSIATFQQAFNACISASIGGRWGWRLPTIQELLRTVGDNDNVIADSPFAFLANRDTFIWSSSRLLGSTSAVYAALLPSIRDKLTGTRGGRLLVAAPAINDPLSAGTTWCVQSPSAGETPQ